MDAWVIDALRRKEERERLEEEERRLPLPLYEPPPGWEPPKPQREEQKRGVVIIDYSV